MAKLVLSSKIRFHDLNTNKDEQLNELNTCYVGVMRRTLDYYWDYYGMNDIPTMNEDGLHQDNFYPNHILPNGFFDNEIISGRLISTAVTQVKAMIKSRTKELSSTKYALKKELEKKLDKQNPNKISYLTKKIASITKLTKPYIPDDIGMMLNKL